MKRTAIALALAAAVSSSAQNLIQNPDFQQAYKDGTAIHWKYRKDLFSRIPSEKPGRFVIKTAKLVLPKDKERVYASIYQMVKIPKPGKYVISFTSRVVDQGAINASWNFLDQNKKMIPIKGACWTAVYMGKTWKKTTHVLDIPEGVAYLQLSFTGRLDARMKHTEGTMMIEEVSMTPQKEE